MKQPDGALDPLAVVVVDATTGEVTEIRRSTHPDGVELYDISIEQRVSTLAPWSRPTGIVALRPSQV